MALTRLNMKLDPMANYIYHGDAKSSGTSIGFLSYFKTAVMICYNSGMKILLARLPGGSLNIKMSSCLYRYPHVKDKTVSRPSYL